MPPKWKRFPPPGTAPGTLLEGPNARAPQFDLMSYTGEHSSRKILGSLKKLPEAPGEGVRWLNIHGLDAELVGALRDRLGLHPLVAEDILNVGQRPKMEAGEGWLVAVVQLFHKDRRDPDLEKEQVSLLLAGNLVVSLQEHAGDPFDPIRQRISQNLGAIRTKDADFLFYALIDAVVDHLFPVLEEIGEEIEDLEDEVIAHPEEEHVERIHRLKRELILLRRAIWPTRELLSRFIRGDSPLLSEDTRYYLRDVYDHAVQLLDVVESYRDILAGLMDLYLSSVSNRMNEVMKVLTVIATVFMPLGFIAGLYGMNFNPRVSPWNMPELDWYYGYPVVLGLMLIIVVIMLWLFRRRRWL